MVFFGKFGTNIQTVSFMCRQKTLKFIFRPYSDLNFGGRNRRPKAENFRFRPKISASGILLIVGRIKHLRIKFFYLKASNSSEWGADGSIRKKQQQTIITINAIKVTIIGPIQADKSTVVPSVVSDTWIPLKIRKKL